MISRISTPLSRTFSQTLKYKNTQIPHMYFFSVLNQQKWCKIGKLSFQSRYGMAKISKKDKDKTKEKEEKKKIKQQIGDTTEFDLNSYDGKYERVLQQYQEKITHFKVGRLDQSYFVNIYAKIGNKNQPVQQLAQIAPRSANVVIFSPYDSDNLDSIEKALQANDMGFQISKVDKTLIVTQPPNTMNDLKKKFIQKLKKETHITKQKLNDIRQQSRNDLKKFKKIIMEDRIKQIESELKTQVQKYITKLDKFADTKQKQLSK